MEPRRYPTAINPHGYETPTAASRFTRLAPAEWKSGQPSIFRAAAFQNALVDVKVLSGGAAEIERARLFDGSVKLFDGPRRIESGKGQVRRKVSRFAGNAQRVEHVLHGAGERGQLRPGLHAGPKYARPPRIRKKSQAAKMNCDRRSRNNQRQRGFDFGKARIRGFADKFQRDVEAFDASPAGFRTGRAQFGNQRGNGRAHFIGDVDGHEEAHRVRPCRCPWFATSRGNSAGSDRGRPARLASVCGLVRRGTEYPAPCSRLNPRSPRAPCLRAFRACLPWGRPRR